MFAFETERVANSWLGSHQIGHYEHHCLRGCVDVRPLMRLIGHHSVTSSAATQNKTKLKLALTRGFEKKSVAEFIAICAGLQLDVGPLH